VRPACRLLIRPVEICYKKRTLYKPVIIQTVIKPVSRKRYGLFLCEKTMKEFEAKKYDEILGDKYVQGYLFEGDQNIIAPRKATQAEKELRIKTIRRLLIAGVNRQSIIEYCELRFCISPKTVYKYFDAINDELKIESTKDKEINYGLAVARMEQALLDCITSKDMTNRARILGDLHKLQGLITHKIKGEGEDGELVIEFVNKSKDDIKKDETE